MDRSSNEMKDLITLQVKVLQEKNTCFDYMEHVMRLDSSTIKNMGHQTIEDALVWRFKQAQAAINKLVDAHNKKYPD